MELADIAGQIGDLLFLEKAAIGGVLVRGVDFEVVGRAGRIVAAPIVGLAREADPAGVEFGMPLESHGSVHLHDQRVVFIKREGVADEALEEGDVRAPRQVEFEGAEGFYGPVADFVKRAPVIAARDHDDVGTGAQDVPFGPRIAGIHFQRMAGAILGHQGAGEGSHDDQLAGGREMRQALDFQVQIETVAQFFGQHPRQKQVLVGGRGRDGDDAGLVQNEIAGRGRRFARRREDRPRRGGRCRGGHAGHGDDDAEPEHCRTLLHARSFFQSRFAWAHSHLSQHARLISSVALWERVNGALDVESTLARLAKLRFWLSIETKCRTDCRWCCSRPVRPSALSFSSRLV